MMRTWKWGFFVGLLAWGIAPSTSAVGAERVFCVGNSGKTLRLRAGPGSSHRVVGALPARACGIKVTGKCSAGWCEVQLGAAKGWADSRFVAIRDGQAGSTALPGSDRQASASRKTKAPATKRRRDAAERSAEATRRRNGERFQPYLPPIAGLPEFSGPTLCVVRVWPGDTLRLRTGPGTSHREIIGIHPGACGIRLRGGCAGSWCPVQYRGVRGWVNASYLRRVWMQ